MNKLKVVTIVGTRPEIIRLSALIPKLDLVTDHILVHTGQNSDPNLNDVFFKDLELRNPDYFLNVDTSSMGSVMGDTIKKSEEIFKKELPDAVMILGDTNSAIAAVVAERMHIPVYHMEAGNRSFDANVPEELNRRMVDHVSSFNLAYNSYSKLNLIREGIEPRRIQITGSPMREILDGRAAAISGSKVLSDLGLKEKGYLLASLHRQENVDAPDRLAAILHSLSEASSVFGLPILISTHPRTRKKLNDAGIDGTDGLLFHDPFNFSDYQKLQLNAFCVISDSGTISEESAILDFPAVSMRESIERPEAMDTGYILLTGLTPGGLVDCIRRVTSIARDPVPLPEGYEVQNFSNRVISFLLSTSRLNRVWAGLH